MPDAAPRIATFDPERIITTLARHDVKYVLIGAVAARLQGSPPMTADADITPERDPHNLQRLATALRELDARVYTESGSGRTRVRLQRADPGTRRPVETRDIYRSPRCGGHPERHRWLR